MQKAVFIDKDGTLIPDIPYNVDPTLISVSPDVAKSLRQLKENGYLLILVSNQSGVARGFFPMSALDSVRQKIQNELMKENVQFDEMYFCPHHPGGVVEAFANDCNCRKPKPGMLVEAASKFDIDLGRSWMIGDILHDVEAGNRAGCRTILLDNGNETEWIGGAMREPSNKVDSFSEAVKLILKRDNHDHASATD